MARTILTALALAAILATAACNSSVTGPVYQDQNTVADQGGDRTPDVFEEPDVIAPDEGGGSGSNPPRGAYNRLHQRRVRIPSDVTPTEGEDSGPGSDQQDNRGLRTRRGRGQVTPH